MVEEFRAVEIWSFVEKTARTGWFELSTLLSQ